MASSSSDSSSSASSPRLPEPKRRQKYFEFSDSDEDDSGDDGLLAQFSRRGTKTSPRPAVSGKRRRTERQQSDNDSDSSNSNNEDDSVSTNELQRRIRGTPVQPKTKSTAGSARSVPSVVQTAPAPSPAALSSQRIAKENAVNLTSHSRSSPSLANQKSPSAIKGSTLTKASTCRSTADHQSEDDSLDDHEKDDCKEDDDSVSTAELARRIRGESVSPHLKKAMPETRTNAEASGQTSVTEVVSRNEDLYLPSPMPSSDESSVEEESEEGDEEQQQQQQQHQQPSSASSQQETVALPPQRENDRKHHLADKDSVYIVQERKQSAKRELLASREPLVREGLRSPTVGPWARGRRLINAGLQQPWNSNNPRTAPEERLEEDIESFSDEDESRLPARTTRKLSLTRTAVRHVTDPSVAANVAGRFSSSFSSNSNVRLENAGLTFPTPQRNDLTGASGVGAGQYQMWAAQEARPSRDGRGRKRGIGKRSAGRGRGRRRGSFRGRGRGWSARGRGGGTGGQSTTYQPGNAWSDYSSHGTAWASNNRSSDLGNVGGAEISF